MKIRLFILLFVLPIRLFGQDNELKETELRDRDNTYLLTSAPFVDKNNFVWYSTNRDGDFYRFDGKYKLKYSYFKDLGTHADSYYISHLAWAQDHLGRIWAAEGEKVYIIDPDRQKVERIDYDWQPLGSSLHSAIGLDKEHNIWISNGSAYLIKIGPDLKPNKVGHPILTNSKQPITILQTTNDGRLFATSGYDLFTIDEKGLHFFGNLQDIDKRIGLNFLLIENGRLFRKGTSGIYRYNKIPHNYTYIKALDVQIFDYPMAKKNTLAIYERGNLLQTSSKLLIANNNDVFVNQINPEQNTITTIDTLRFKTTIAINANKNNNLIWIMGSDKLYKLMMGTGHFKRILQSGTRKFSTRTILTDKHHNLYIASYQGLYKLGMGKSEAEGYLVGNSDMDYFECMLHEKNSNVLWSWLSSNYMIRIELGTRKKKMFKLSGKWEVNCMQEIALDELLLGTSKGLYIFNKHTAKVAPYKEAIIFNDIAVYDVLTASDGTLWIATKAGLFFRKGNGPFLNYKNMNRSFVYRDLLKLYQSSSGLLWIGTYNDGVVSLDVKTGRTQKFDQTKGLSNNKVIGILESKKALWFATFYGLNRFDKQKQQFTSFYKEDGLADNEFNLRSSFKRNDSSLYFGGINGVVEFNPEKLEHQTKRESQIFLYSARYFSTREKKEVTKYLHLGQQTINLPYNKNYFSARFVVNELFYNDRNTYAYKIDNLTNGWVDAGTSGIVELFGLPPGNYVLQVKGKDMKGQDTINEISIKLQVKQLFFKTPLFIGLTLVLIICLAGYFVIRKNNSQRKQLEREREIMSLKASALKAQMNPHFVFNVLNNLQSVLILKGAMEVTKYFAAFTKLLRITLDMSRQDLVSLSDEIEYINNYLMLNKLQLNDELEYKVHVDDNVGNTNKIMLPGMLVQPFVENAIIHGLLPKEDRRLIVTYTLINGYLEVSITDNGVGRTAAMQMTVHKKESYRSWATSIVNERIRILNNAIKDGEKVTLEIRDLLVNDEPTGTQVVLRFKTEMEK